MEKVPRSVVVGVFEERRHAQRAVEELRAAGFPEDRIGVISRDGHTAEAETSSHHSMVAEGAATGALAGAGAGALWALGIAAGVLPAIGPVIAGGVLASILASAAGGAAVAGVVGALIGLGIPEEEAEFYESEFRSGRTLLTVRTDGRYDEVVEILRRQGASEMTPSTRSAQQTFDVPVQRNDLSSGPAEQKVAGSEVRVGGETNLPLKEHHL